VATAFGATLGIEVCTHKQVARQVLEANGVVWTDHTAWLGEVAREAADAEPVLAGALGNLSDGYGLVARISMELMDAGLRSEQVEAMEEAVRDWPGRRPVGAGVAPRVAALLRVAGTVERQARSYGACSTATGLQLACEFLRDSPETTIDLSGTVVVGFADATGRVADLVEALRRHAGAIVGLEAPPNPSNPKEEDAGCGFAEPFRARFEGLPPNSVGEYGGAPKLTLLQAADPYEEAAAAAESIAELIGDGGQPEDIAVVVRNLEGWAGPLCEALRERGVPFSGVDGRKPGGALYRRSRALACVLEQFERVPLSRWWEAIGHDRPALVALAADSVGARVLADVPTRFIGRVRTGARSGIESADGVPRLGRIYQSSSETDRVRLRAEQALDLLNDWPISASIDEHCARLRSLFRRCAGVEPESPIDECVDALARQVPKDVDVSREAVVRMACNALRSVGEVPLGGNGGGVSVLSATEARGRTFGSLFLLGMTRGSFPRIVREDPLFPDAARRSLRALLPDLRERRLGLLEERFLFAQMLSSATSVQLSTARVGLTGARQHASSLVVELQLNRRMPDATCWSGQQQKAFWREAIARGLRGADLESVVSMGGGSAATVGLTAARNGRARVIEPFIGSIGPAVHPLDTRNRPWFITQVEQVARCPWSALLTRLLGVSERPDPFGELPSVNSHLLGVVVHDVIERLVRSQIPEGEAGKSVPLIWPGDSTLNDWIRSAAVEALAESGVAWRGFAQAVQPSALLALHELRTMDAELEGVLGGEVELEWEREDGPSVHFRADRLATTIDGTTLITDFKLGKPPTNHKTENTRRKKLVSAVREGRLLQGLAYARSRDDAVGRYLYLNPGIDMPVREFRFGADDAEMVNAMDAVVSEVQEALETGAMFPRVSEASRDAKPAACGYCAVREACPVEDSSLRMSVMRAVNTEAPGALSAARSELWWRGQGGGNDE
jgi:RecB family exonuclease